MLAVLSYSEILKIKRTKRHMYGAFLLPFHMGL